MASSPTVTPLRIVTLAPIHTLRPMVIGAGCMSPRRSGWMSWSSVGDGPPGVELCEEVFELRAPTVAPRVEDGGRA